MIKQGRQMLGETQPLASKPGSIRGDYSIDLGRNICHGKLFVDWRSSLTVRRWTEDLRNKLMHLSFFLSFFLLVQDRTLQTALRMSY